MNVSKLKKDFVWYSVGAAVPMILNFIKTPIFTRHFSPTDYGYLTLINTTYSYINLFAFSWLLSCVWRYYLHEKNNNELEKFYTNIIFLFLVGLIITSIATIIWIICNNNMLIKKLVLSNYINLITASITGIYLVIIRLDGKSFLYNLYNISISIMSFILLFVLTFVFNSSIDAMLNCNNIVNVLFSIYIAYSFLKNYKINGNNISKKFIKELITYGFATVFFNMSLLLLTSGDRYVIKIFYSTDKVGIYNQIYNLAQISIVAFINIFFNIINPYAFKQYEEDVNNENEFYKYIVLYIICLLPCTVYFSLYSKQIATLLLGQKFRVGYKMMPYVMISSFIYGLSGMHETRMKFKNKLKPISINLITASVINIILNFIFIPTKGYEYAAVTTLISYIYLYIMDTKVDIPNINIVLKIFKSKYNLIITIFSILFFQISFHYLIKRFVTYFSIAFAIVEGSIFLLTFYLYIYYVFKKHKLMLNK